MKPHKLRLIAIALAALSCWWCATSNSPLPSPRTADAAPSPRTNFVSPETTRACQSVVYQMVTIQQFVSDEKLPSPMAAMDELVAQEYRIDTSKCPTDFRLAVMRLVMAEDSARTRTFGQNRKGRRGVGRRHGNKCNPRFVHRQVPPVPERLQRDDR